MSCLDKLDDNPKIGFIAIVLLFFSGIIHLIFCFYVKQTDFDNIFDTFDSSPLFDFNYSENCGKNTKYIFQVWEGLEDTEYFDDYYNLKVPETKTTYKTDLTKINKKYFCYKPMSYKKLLYNSQIRKEDEEYKGIYTKDCGIIDTLNQHLFIEEGENCPLYDVGIGTPDDSTYYIEDKSGEINIYYNNNNYDKSNKKIIGRLTLSEGQPCYRQEEKLWRKFLDDEAGEGKLKCELKIFGNLTDNRYLNKGNITYDQLYRENINVYEKLFEDEKDDLKKYEVSLYKREFLGIDKSCDEKNSISKEDYNQLRKYQKKGRTCLLVEAIIIISFPGLAIIGGIAVGFGCPKDILCPLILVIPISIITYFICIICQAVYLGKVIYYDLAYNCSDEITNEVLKNENINTKKSILYLAINLGLDILFILISISPFIIDKIKDKCKKEERNYNYPPQPQIFVKNINNNANNNYNTPVKPGLNNNINNINQPIREVVVDNKIQTQGEVYNKPVNPVNYTTSPNPNPVHNLGVPPTVEQGATSNTKF